MEERNERLDEFLNEAYETVTIGGIEFSPADILYELDPTAYRCMVADMGFDDEDDEDEEY